MTGSRTAVDASIEHCLGEVRSDADHQISFGSRRKMLSCFGVVSLPLEALDGKVTRGHLARAAIARCVMERALPTWADNFSGDSGDVQLIFDILVDPNLNTKRRKLFREGMALKNHLDGGAPAGLNGYQYVWAGYAIAMGAMAVAQDEYLDLERQGGTQIDLEDPETHHSYDAGATSPGGTVSGSAVHSALSTGCGTSTYFGPRPRPHSEATASEEMHSQVRTPDCVRTTRWEAG